MEKEFGDVDERELGTDRSDDGGGPSEERAGDQSEDERTLDLFTDDEAVLSDSWSDGSSSSGGKCSMTYQEIWRDEVDYSEQA